MSSEMREFGALDVENLRSLREVVAGTEHWAKVVSLDRAIALLARTEAGADGAVYQMMATDEDVDEDGNVRPDDPRLWMDHTREEYERLKDHPSVRSRIVYTHPQDASGDAAKLSEIERKAVTDLMESQVYEAGGVDDEPPSIDEDEDAYWAYHNYHGLRKLLAMQAKEAK